MSIVKISRRNKDNENPTRFYSTKQEKQVEKELGGKRTPNSGATKFEKGDVKIDDFLIECKTKTKNSESISIKKEWIEKINQESLFMGKPSWAIAFNFGPDEENYYIVDEKTFQEHFK